MGAISSGAHVVFPTPQGYRGDGVFDNFWKLIERWKITFIITVPTAVSQLMQRPVDADISSIKQAFSDQLQCQWNYLDVLRELLVWK